ncbi:MAG: MBOAT family O-acyltransferase, partial [Planctomycetota bacterium]
MQFNSLHFAAFFALVLTAVAASRSHVRVRNCIILAASYYFYGSWDYRFLSLIVISTLIDYACGRMLNVRTMQDQPPARSRRDRAVLAVSLCSNLGILGFFKYFDFFVTSTSAMLEELGVTVHVSTLNIILPVGISFYTFQTLSYTIDLYRGKVRTEDSLLNFAVYVAYFPQLVAGPIERARHLLPQVQSPHAVDWAQLNSGFFLIGWGLFKKVVIADNIAVIVDLVFASETNTGLSTVLGVYAFAIQIYCDFSGYVDIARGAARCMGFDLMQNFNLPYFATNPSDFWRRWHISLSTWLRDYLYIPLGGSKCGRTRTYINLMLTMVLGGLWHGAAWTFVVWGIYLSCFSQRVYQALSLVRLC